MKTSIDIELARQLYRPGDEISGEVHIKTEKELKARELIISFQGEEILSANSITRSIILPLINEQLTFSLLKTEDTINESSKSNESEPYMASFPIKFKIPDTMPPSYASDIFRCSYFIKARLSTSWIRDIIEKMHITIVPYQQELEKNEPIILPIEEENLNVKIEIDKEHIQAGETLTGSMYMEHTSIDPPLQVSFELRAQERSIDDSFNFKRTVWNNVKEVSLKDTDTGYMMARFEFQIPLEAPFSNQWNGFEVCWSFLVTFTFADGKDVKLDRVVFVERMI